MNINTLKSVIDYAMQQVISSQVSILDDTTGYGYESADYYEMQVSEIHDLQLVTTNLKDTLLHNGDDKDPVELISSLDLSNVLMLVAYDTYGELYRKNNNQRVSFETYLKEAKIFSIDSITEAQWHDAYDFTADLYEENESEGSHDKNGHYIKYMKGGETNG